MRTRCTEIMFFLQIRRRTRQTGPTFSCAVAMNSQGSPLRDVGRRGAARGPAGGATRRTARGTVTAIAVMPAGGPERALGVDAQQGMPTQALDALEQPLGIQAPIGEHDHRPGRRRLAAQRLQQGQPFGLPGMFEAGGQHLPQDRDRTASIHHADHQQHEALAERGRIEGQGPYKCRFFRGR